MPPGAPVCGMDAMDPLRNFDTISANILDRRRPGHDAADDLIALCYTSEDFQGAVKRFVDKTPYTWQGR